MPTYAEALAYLDSFINYEKVPGIGYGARRYDLNSFARFLAALGNPHYLHDCLHVAGTKGKGSTSALAAAGLTGLGLKVGLYTSPHLVTIRERISVGGRLVREEEFARIITELQPVAARLGRTEKTFRTFFELVTAAGMLHFQASGCGQVVYETGMGGRLDATNVVPAGVAGITAISIDHTQALGATLAAIATEKAGIIKPGQMVISAAQEPDAAAVLRETSRRRRATLLEVGTDIDFVIRRHDINGLMCDVRYLDETPLRLAIPLAGRHQAENCAVAYGMV
ncbi:bifunctional folylpolyglutamate synthase/dihydrofolate synthase, partial [bacterium]|nr:bifunctional folylpolyglutamate synthase/dihydrofolate synthase [candidate division CSSED10-310 bacterium]